MNEQNQQENIPAFPVQPFTTSGRLWSGGSEGMTLRDYFAASSLNGWMASYNPDAQHPVAGDCHLGLAQLSYAMADAMMEARKITE